ncbi:MAG TPA: cytochrome c-type biogenesis CcmF C-terminal domain-containing protein, partial [Phenylobacterium sp.]
AVPLGGQVQVGGYHLILEDVEGVEGPNYEAERGRLVARKGERVVCRPAPERRLYLPGGQTTSEVAICYEGLSHLYVVLGERREAAGGPTWLVRAYFNPLAVLIFLGPAIMALGGVVSLSDRRLRIGVARRAEAAAA